MMRYKFQCNFVFECNPDNVDVVAEMYAADIMATIHPGIPVIETMAWDYEIKGPDPVAGTQWWAVAPDRELDLVTE